MTAAASSSEGREGDAGLLARLSRTPLRDILRGRLSERLSIRRQIAAAALPQPVADLVLKVVKRTRLWRLEKAEVAEELVAHFADGLEADASAEQLIESFGDMRAAARLIRRAKKRQRPLTWHAARYAMRGIAAIILLYLLYGVYFWMGSPSPTTDYLAQLNAVAASVPDEDRAWPLYRAALLDLDDMPKFEGYSRAPLPGEIGWDEAQAYLEGQQEALALARRAAQRPGLGFVIGHEIAPEDRELWPGLESSDDAMLISVNLPYLAKMRRLAKVLALDARRAASAGDGETAVADLAALLGMARHAREAPIIICDLVSISIVRLAIEVGEDVLIDRPEALTEAQLADLAHRLAACDACLKSRLDGERLTFYDIVQRLYTDDGEGDGRMTAEGLRLLTQLKSIWGMDGPPMVEGEMLGAAMSPAVGLIMPSRRAVVDDYERVMTLFESEASRPLWQMQSSQAEQLVETWQDGTLSRVRHLLTTFLLPALSQVHMTSEKAIMRRDALLAAIALEIHHRRHGDWPAMLDELVPDLLPAVPPDRFDGQPLRYALIDGAPVLYSIGSDRDDDGGRPPLAKKTGRPDYYAAQRWLPPLKRPDGSREEVPDGDWILWPVPEEPIYRYEP